MKLHEYLESTYVSTNLELQKEFSPYLQAKTHAVQKLINAQRAVYRVSCYPTLLFGFIAVCLGLKAKPRSPKELAEEAYAAHPKAIKADEATTPVITNPVEINPTSPVTH